MLTNSNHMLVASDGGCRDQSAESKLALRLKLFAFGQEDYKEVFDTAAERLRTLNEAP